MDCQQSMHNNIITKDQKTNYIFKLTQGTAKIINQYGNIAKTIQAPFFLNLVECLYSVPTLKTIQAVGKCQVKKIVMKESHKNFLKDLKQRGVRKSKFKVFQEIHSSKFYELVRLGVLIQLRKGEQFAAKDKHFYFMISGSIIASQKQSILKMFRMQQGFIWCGAQTQIQFKSQADETKIIEVASSIVYCILQEKETQLINLGKYQNETVQNFKQRNERVDKHIQRSNEKHYTKLVMSKNFANLLQYKYNNQNNKMIKAKSCYLSKNGIPKKPREIIEQIQKEKQSKYMELLQINRRKYKKSSLYSDSMNKLYSLSCKATPEKNNVSGTVSRINFSNSSSNKGDKVNHKENDSPFDKSHITQTVYKILKRNQSSRLLKRSYNRNKAKLTFPMGLSRKDSSQSLVQWKLT